MPFSREIFDLSLAREGERKRERAGVTASSPCLLRGSVTVYRDNTVCWAAVIIMCIYIAVQMRVYAKRAARISYTHRARGQGHERGERRERSRRRRRACVPSSARVAR